MSIGTEATASEAAARIDVLLAGFATDPAVAERAEDLVRAVIDLYDGGLGRLVTAIEDAGGGGALRRAAADPVVASMLVLHDLHPVPVRERVAAALDGVRPYLGSHAGDVELVDVTGDEATGGVVVRLRLTGSCDGCAASTVTVHDTIERAIAQAAPEVSAIEVDGVEGGVEEGGVAVEGVEVEGVEVEGGAPAGPRDVAVVAGGGAVSGGRTLLPIIGTPA